MKTLKTILGLGLFLTGGFLFTQCENDLLLSDNSHVQAIDTDVNARKGPGGGGGGEAVGANLSFPVIWSEGVKKTLRVPPAGTVDGIKLTGAWWYVWGVDPIDPQAPLYSCNPALLDPCYPEGTPDLYKAHLQKDANNYWEAYNANATEPLNVDLIDWGDNLESIDWGITSKVRTEVVLYENLSDTVLQYAMRHVSGWGTDEMHGLQTDLEGNPQYGPGTQATIYSPHARLTIQKLTAETPNLTWDSDTHAWVGDARTPIFNMAVWQAADGPGYYNAEVNIKGKVIYGYTWDVKKLNDGGAGVYRITFSFDGTGQGPTTNLNTFFDSNTNILLPVVEGEITPAAEDDGGGGTAYVDPANNLSYIDVTIKPGKGGSGKPLQ